MSNFDNVLISKPSSGFFEDVGYVYPYALAIIAMVTTMIQFYKLDSSFSLAFLAYEKNFKDGAVAYEPWFSIFYLIGLALIVLWTYRELAPRSKESVAIDAESGNEREDSTPDAS
ncbi:hypothetical protein [Novipirellula maiorica]|uniref:hypothetical protein n=1 Tax=Novipirellula maiorica TaxID=1265734 RepID=UPI001181A9BA|nr:hypothetical protein [Rhodopirellula maiorica]